MSLQAHSPVYQLPELPQPDRPLLVQKPQQSGVLPLLVRACVLLAAARELGLHCSRGGGPAQGMHDRQ
jgi:hypothetical protein